jgi:arginine utilization protein RocB
MTSEVNMGVRTTADELIDKMRDHLDKCAREAMDKNTWGSEDYNKEFRDKIFETEIEIRRLQKRLE